MRAICMNTWKHQKESDVSTLQEEMTSVFIDPTAEVSISDLQSANETQWNFAGRRFTELGAWTLHITVWAKLHLLKHVCFFSFLRVNIKISLYLLNQCLFIVFTINTTLYKILYSFVHHFHYDTFRPVITVIIR